MSDSYMIAFTYTIDIVDAVTAQHYRIGHSWTNICLLTDRRHLSAE